MSNLFCAIPARLGSQRVPRKNLRDMAGKPMLVYSIEAALGTNLFAEVYVCTESEEIAKLARSHGATVPALVPEELCGDLVSSWQPCVHMLNQVSQETGVDFESLLCLQPTSPLRSVEDIRSCTRAFAEGDYDYLLSVTEIDPHYFHWALQKEDGWRMVFGDDYLIERPLLPPRYRPNGSIKMARVAELLKKKSFFGEKLMCIETPEERSVHVGTEFEFRLAEFLLSQMQRGDT